MTKKYFWMLFDYAIIDFTHWLEVEKRLKMNDDAVVFIKHYAEDSEDELGLLHVITYMFSIIYNS